MNRKALRGSLLLLLGAVIWGAAFAAQRAGMDHVGPFTFSGVRMLLAGIVMIPASMLSRRKAGPVTAEVQKKQRRGGLICGLLLFFATSLQQIGLVYTSAGKAGFITALYVVLVPVAGWVFLRKQPGKMIWAGVGLAVIALYLLCVPAEGFVIEKGDALLLGCAVCFTGQILCVDHYAPQVDGLTLARDEFLITGALSMIIAVFTEEIRMDGILEAAFPIIYSGIFSGAVGYSLQIIGQRDVNPTVASLVMCLEAVFAVLTGAILLGERMTGREIAGCVLMFCAVILAQLSAAFKGNCTQKERKPI
ncbi:MAG: DMT family transporter [Clostridia bacterium]|nr:DMT family transporter [Clostridia bacterium]